MKIILVHSYYKQRGGEDESVEAEVRVLREYGHQVMEFYETNSRIQSGSGLMLAAKAIWSWTAYRALVLLIRKERPDVVVMHNLLPLISPSVMYACRWNGVPVIQYLQNFRRLCPSAILYRDGHVCEACIGRWVAWPGIRYHCYRNSLAATATVAAINAVHRLLRTWSCCVDRYIAVSEFTKAKCVEGGIPAGKIRVKPNFVHPDPGSGDGGGGHILFVGRLAPEKGVETLIRAWRSVSGLPSLKIVGDGPEGVRLRNETKSDAGIEWLGSRSISEVMELMGQAAVLVFPSEWYETFGRVAAEAFAKGTPVITTDHGAMKELVEEGKTGFLFKPGDVESLAYVLKQFFSMDHPCRLAMRVAARAEYERKYTAEYNLEMLMGIIREVVPHS
jgi:glycosyltransferase involved in cell wall biosynthesis